MLMRECCERSGGRRCRAISLGRVCGVFAYVCCGTGVAGGYALRGVAEEGGRVGGTVATESGGAGAGAQGEASRQVFESELKEKYAGSAVFYSKLPPATQEEIFLEYRSGASIAELRKKIMDRFLHR